MRVSAPSRYGVSRSRQRTGNSHWHWFRPAPRILGEFDPCGQIPPRRFLIGAPAGAQRSGSGGERTAPAGAFRRPTARRAALRPEMKERSLSGIFGFSRKWSGGVSSDDMGGAMNQPSSWLKSPPPVRAGKTPFRPKGGHPISSDGTQDKSTSSISVRCRRGRDRSGQSC